MRNIKLTIAYDGSRYSGWQVQRPPRGKSKGGRRLKQALTIQAEIEGALARILQEKIRLIGSGRTDAGVHAIAQVANFKTSSLFPLKKLKNSLNALLPDDIAVYDLAEAPLDFHARFGATSKTYRYLILNGDGKTVFLSSWVCSLRDRLDVVLMRQEAVCLLGRHDFKSFQASDRRERASVRTVKRLSIKRARGSGGLPFSKGVDLIEFEIEADGFLFNMVRNIAGTLIEVGRGRISGGRLKEILEGRDRRLAGPCAPAKGLWLIDVRYPDVVKASPAAAREGFASMGPYGR